MGKPKVDKDGVCIDFKNWSCGMCARRNTAKCCYAVPKYQKKIDAWNRKMRAISDEMTGVTLAINSLESVREQTMDKLSGDDWDRVNYFVQIAERQPGIRIRFMHEGVERSCFECIHCDETFLDEPCIHCLGGMERHKAQIPDRDYRYERYAYAANFELKYPTEKDRALRTLTEKYVVLFSAMKKDAANNKVSVYELLAGLLSAEQRR